MRNALMSLGMLLAVPVGLNACCLSNPRHAHDRDALIGEDFVKATSGMKVAIAEYYNNMDKLPRRNADAGLAEPGQYVGETLRSATVGPDGSIELVFDAKSGKDGGRIRLVPDMSHANAMGVTWRCETSDYPHIERAVPNCSYVSR